jgi:hypothetical protein
MMPEDELPKSIGLGGDGDEVAAIREVERAFGVKLNYDDAPKWFTAGDVYASLLAALPPDEEGKSETWARFAEAITSETGVDPRKIVPGSPLIGGTKVPWWAIVLAIGAIWALAYFLRL